MRIEIRSGQRAGEAVDLAAGVRVVIGREEGCDLALPDELVSRRHLALTGLPDGTVTVEDLGSSNGTFVDGVRIGQPVVLRGGEEVRLGSTALRVRAPGERRGPSRAGLLVVLAAAAVAAGGVAGGLLATRGGDLEVGPIGAVTGSADTAETGPEPQPTEIPPVESETETAGTESTEMETETQPPEPEQPAADGPGAAVEALLARVPDDHRDACRPTQTYEQPGAVTAVECRLPDASVTYTQFDSPQSMGAAYRERLDGSEVEEDTGSGCMEQLPSEGAYSVDGVKAGRLACYWSFGNAAFGWTHDATGILGLAFADDDAAVLWEWWSQSSGPLETAADIPPTGLGAALEALYASVPDGHRDTCSPFYAGEPERGFVTGLACDVSDDLSVYYSLLDSPEHLENDYRRELGEQQENTGDCAQALPAEHPYTIDGEPAGRLYCRESLGGIELTWTHERTLINGTAFSEGTPAELWEWWLSEAGPVG